MTENQKLEIRKLRNNGLGYKKIAASTGLSESAVKSFCHRNNLAGRRVESVPKCQCCGKTITVKSNRRPRKFCSGSCRQKWWNQHRHNKERKSQIEKRCPNCGKKFLCYEKDNRIYCSHHCYINSRFHKETAYAGS